jgi:hypothetical protein
MRGCGVDGRGPRRADTAGRREMGHGELARFVRELPREEDKTGSVGFRAQSVRAIRRSAKMLTSAWADISVREFWFRTLSDPLVALTYPDLLEQNE